MPFTFLELPQEIQDMILTEYIQCNGLTVKARLSTTRRRKVRFEGIPSLAIELVCRKISKETRHLRSQLWPRKLHFDENMFTDTITHVGTDMKYTWLHHHIQHISAGRLSRLDFVGPFKFQKLRSLAVNEMGNWNLDARLTSFEALKKAYANQDSHWIVFAEFYGRLVPLLSGRHADRVDLILVGKGRLKHSDSVVEVHKTFNYIKNEDQLFEPYLASTKFFVGGKEIDPVHYDLMRTRL